MDDEKLLGKLDILENSALSTALHVYRINILLVVEKGPFFNKKNTYSII